MYGRKLEVLSTLRDSGAQQNATKLWESKNQFSDCLCQKGGYFVPTVIITFNFFVCIIFYFIRPLQEQQLLCLKTA